MSAQLPATWVAAGYGVPDVCGRHGLPADQRKRVRFISRPPAWTYALIVAGGLVFVIVATALRKTVTAQAWPFCPRCREHRTRQLIIGLGVLALSAVLFGLAIGVAAVNSHAADSLTPLGVLLAVVAFIAGVAVAARSAPNLVAGGQVSQDGAWLLLPRASAEFARRVPPVQPVPPAQYHPQQQYGFPAR